MGPACHACRSLLALPRSQTAFPESLEYWPSGKSVTCSYPLPGASPAGGPHLGDRVIYGILQFSSAVGAEFETI